MITGRNWWRANDIVMRHLTHRIEARNRCRDKAVDRVMLGELISQLGVALRFVRHDVRLAVQIIADNL
jgi:hypothetical protein